MSHQESKNAVFNDPEFLTVVARDFVRASASAETFEEVYAAFLKVFIGSLNLENSHIFEVLPKENKVYRCLGHEKEPSDFSQMGTLDFGEGIVGTVAESQRPVLIRESVQKEPTDIQPEVSVLCVPIQFHGELFGVIYSSHTSPGFFTDQHLSLFELTADIAASLLARIRQKIELNHLKITLEHLLEDKKAALDIAVETVSTQFSELKFQRDKKEILLREVHHRVNNNLQIISSLVSLYLSETKEPGHQTLKEIQCRIEILSSIHLILLKSLELNQTSLAEFLADLSSSLRYICKDNYLVLNCDTGNIETPLSLNTLIPLGMLTHELVLLAIRKYWKVSDVVEINLTLNIDELPNHYSLVVQGSNCGKSKNEILNHETVQQTIIQALCEQLEGEMIETDTEECQWSFKFKEI